MCNPISLVMSEDAIHAPSRSGWDHHHSSIMEAAGIPNSLIGDRWARIEVLPPGGKWRDPDTNAVLGVDDSWEVVLDEQRAPAWWSDDIPAQEHRAREAARKWLASCSHCLVPGAVNTGGHDSTNIGGDGSTNTGGDRSTNTGGHGSTNTGGYGSTNTGGYYSTNTGGDYSTNTGGYGSTNTGGDDSTNTGGYGSINTGGERSVLIWRGSTIYVAIVGKDGIKPDTPYHIVDGKIVEKKEDTQ